ncbi:MAG: putative di-heme cytochrome c peroxidase [Herminiimonas sp.]|nr:putative di-heme cytochrome c peroxidase [Herminiimonas sp.]
MKKVMLAMAMTALLLAGCGDNADSGKVQSPLASSPATQFATNLGLSARVGQKIFFDKTLSGSGKMSCASCHDPQSAYGSPNNLSVQLGGTDMATAGTRAVPALRYTQVTPAYADLLDNPDGISVPGPGGGFTWDGRANTLADQARIPLLAPNEMANIDAEAVVTKLRQAPYAAMFEQAFGKDALANTDAAFANAMQALQAFQLEDPAFHPYTSKFDLYAGNKIGGNFTPAETRGLKVFSDPATGNCASCHYQGAGLNGSSGLFTDFSYEAISVPRNPAIAANQDPAYFDMGLCGPTRTDHSPSPIGSPNKFCGMFKAPGLRNVATRNTFFHNGVMHSLEQVIRFYNTRDTMPELWYPTVGGTAKPTPDAGFPMYGLITTQYTGGTVQKYNDLPAAYRGNIDTQLPLDGRTAGSPNPMTEAQIADLICFLKTLTDGYDPAAQNPASGACGK